MASLTAEMARELLDYDPETGDIHWRASVSKNVKVGALAGSKRQDGYIQIRFDGKFYMAHRLAWLITNGAWPIEHIDHINGVHDDNCITNLREASHSLNLQNQRLPSNNNKSGYLGVSWCAISKAFRARIVVQGKQRYLGRFTDPAEAHQAYLTAKRQLHAGCTI